MSNLHICVGVGKDFTCYYNGACFGEICIDPKRCRKKPEELTEEDKRSIENFNKEIEKQVNEPA